MATSSITKTFIVEGPEQAEIFANAIEESYQESLTRKEELDFNIHYIETPEEFEAYIEKWKKARG